MLLESRDFKPGSIQEYLACLVWYKEKTIFAKSIASILLSNIDPSKSADRFESLLSDIYPGRKQLLEERAKEKENIMKAMRGKVIKIGIE